MAEIARRAGVGNATVFRRFPTKDALYEAIVDEKIAELSPPRPSPAEIGDPWDALVRYLETTAELQARDRGFFQATEQYLLSTPSCCAATGRSSMWSIRCVLPRPGGGRRARRRHHARRPRAWSRARSPAYRRRPACAPTAGGARWPSCSTRCGPRRPRRCRSRRSPTRRSSGARIADAASYGPSVRLSR